MESVTIHRRTAGPPDAHGNATSTFTDVVVTALAVYRGVTEEPGNNRDAVDTEINLALPSSADIAAEDEVTVRGVRYPVLGDPFEWVNNVTRRSWGIQVRLGRVEG